MRPIRIVIADDDRRFRKSLCEQIRDEPNMEILDELADGLDAIAAVARLDPDVLTVAEDLPGLNGLDVLEVVRWWWPETKVIVISGRDDEDAILEALRRGARGYVVKGDEPDVARMIQAVHQGEVWARRRVLATLIEQLRQEVADDPDPCRTPLSQRPRGWSPMN